MPVTVKALGHKAEAKREFHLEKREGTMIRCLIPESYTVGQAKQVLAERSGYEPDYSGEAGNVRLAVKFEDQCRLVPDETTFRELEEGACLKAIPSLAPARL